MPNYRIYVPEVIIAAPDEETAIQFWELERLSPIVEEVEDFPEFIVDEDGNIVWSYLEDVPPPMPASTPMGWGPIVEEGEEA